MRRPRINKKRESSDRENDGDVRGACEVSRTNHERIGQLKNNGSNINKTWVDIEYGKGCARHSD